MSLHCFNFHVLIIKNGETYWSILCFGCFRMQKTLERYYRYTEERQIDRNGMERYMQVRPLYLNLITFEISLGKRQYLKTWRTLKMLWTSLWVILCVGTLKMLSLVGQNCVKIYTRTHRHLVHVRNCAEFSNNHLFGNVFLCCLILISMIACILGLKELVKSNYIW